MRPKSLAGTVIDIAGIPRTPMDSVIIAATNKANYDELAQDATAHAQIDRFASTNMGFATRPHEVLETMLYMKSVGLIAKPLNTSSAEEEEEGEIELAEDTDAKELNASLRELFPLPQDGQPVLGPDGRYRMWFKEGRTKDIISLMT